MILFITCLVPDISGLEEFNASSTSTTSHLAAKKVAKINLFIEHVFLITLDQGKLLECLCE